MKQKNKKLPAFDFAKAVSAFLLRFSKLSGFLVGLVFFFVAAGILLISVRGVMGHPKATELNVPSWKEDGPFELSPERGRYALTYSIVEDKSLFFSTDIARFTTPDLGIDDGNYVSLFAPMVSYLAIPGYIIGSYFGATQVGAFATSAFFALLNGSLIYLIIRKLKMSSWLGLLMAFCFMFATPAYAYATTLYQHHISTFLVLGSLYLTIAYTNFWSMALVWFLIALAIPIDYPNLFFMFPIGLFNLLRLIGIKKENNKIYLNIKIIQAFSVLAVTIPLAFFLWFNNASYGDPLQLSGTVPSVAAIDEQGKPSTPGTISTSEDAQKYLRPETQSKSAINFFKTRHMTNGLYILFLSPDRGMIYFAPLVLLGVFGYLILIKKHDNYMVLTVAVIVANVTLYSLWGDPWGGWAFGSRYLIPAYAMAVILLAAVLQRYKKNLIVIALFTIICGFSVYVNTAGALSSIANPPQIQILALEKITGRPLKYSYDRNLEYLQNESKSFVYQSFLKDNYSSWQFFQTTLSVLIAMMMVSVVGFVFSSRKESNEE